MIKKSLLGLFVGFVGLVGFSYGLSFNDVLHNGSYNQSPVDSSIDIAVYSRGLLSSTRLGVTKRMLAFISTTQSSSTTRNYFWWDNGKPYFYRYYGYNGTKAYGVFTKYYICNETIAINSTGVNQCVHDYIDYDTLPYFFNSVTSSDYYGFTAGPTTLRLCFSSNSLGKTICFDSEYGEYSSNGMQELSGDLTFSGFPDSLLGDPPGRSTSGGGSSEDGYTQSNGGIELNTNDSALNYFETMYGWDKSICYVGVNNVTSLYGSNGVSFQKGGGLSIFDVFNQLYGNSDIDKVYVWLNTWLLNYENWFNTDGNPRYLANYNSGSNSVDLYYDNLTFPFANNPVALYFMADNIENYSPYSTMGSSVVSYCNMKINSGTFDQIIDQSDKNNITNFTEKYNTNQGLNSDGSNKEYGAWLSTGVDIAFSGNTSIKNSLKNFFDTINENINVSEGTSTLQILPTWLLSALMFVILFKFLRKR